jgi:hypothetical protein
MRSVIKNGAFLIREGFLIKRNITEEFGEKVA